MNSELFLKNTTSTNDSSLENLIIYSKSSNDEQFQPPDIEIREIKRIDEKMKWMKLFAKHYSGSKNKLNQNMVGNIARFFVGSINGIDVGYIRITNYTNSFKNHYCGQVWNASDAYVKNRYRQQSVLRQLLTYVIKNCNVKMAKLETDRLINNRLYYTTLGFTFSRNFTSGLSTTMTDEIKDAYIEITSQNK